MRNQLLSSRHPGYYEAIIQVRPKNVEVHNFIREQVASREDCMISKEDILKKGIDFYLTGQRYALALSKKIREKFKAKTLISRQLYSINRNTSRKLYRVTILIRLPEEKEQII
ncbi:MAG TPA: NMD3-related protein [Candidatus Nanoarchaeia archaeon]|nr:NMD3-related protein [Candidatus Nanoarchaeia archaeon]